MIASLPFVLAAPLRRREQSRRRLCDEMLRQARWRASATGAGAGAGSSSGPAAGGNVLSQAGRTSHNLTATRNNNSQQREQQQRKHQLVLEQEWWHDQRHRLVLWGRSPHAAPAAAAAASPLAQESLARSGGTGLRRPAESRAVRRDERAAGVDETVLRAGSSRHSCFRGPCTDPWRQACRTTCHVCREDFPGLRPYRRRW
jgi:hypothetical protein